MQIKLTGSDSVWSCSVISGCIPDNLESEIMSCYQTLFTTVASSVIAVLIYCNIKETKSESIRSRSELVNMTRVSHIVRR
jgi:putative exporter of polyketide antibiotics